MRTVPRRVCPAGGAIVAGVLLAQLGTGCGIGQQTRGDDDVPPPPVPDGFVGHTKDGIGYALPEGFDDRPAEVDVIVAEDPMDSVRDVARDAITGFQRSTRLTYTDREYEYAVPGAENAQRSDYEFSAEYAPESLRRPDRSGASATPSRANETDDTKNTDGAVETIRGVDVAMLLDDGTGITFRLIASSDYLNDNLADRVLGTLYVIA
ncbi:hypothetical protein CDO52_21815 [Nocardiopsis gilva YIM 90087]|uniref:Uncharacterized protein n=1 Tax=Nocardiopsis gilva YIM 90087 TaxID=1235441 RepID=A0A223SAC8_9ACTN|nr:hypothetical protein [Nocardiopsis gilva]ASU85077.1 hypothetical protein CDO52_21815 [Nocardiopsis gilva YIM 90087]